MSLRTRFARSKCTPPVIDTRRSSSGLHSMMEVMTAVQTMMMMMMMMMMMAVCQLLGSPPHSR